MDLKKIEEFHQQTRKNEQAFIRNMFIGIAIMYVLWTILTIFLSYMFNI